MPIDSDYLQAITPEAGVNLVRTLLQVQYQRQFEQLHDIIKAFREVNWKGLESQWELLFQSCPNKEEAFHLFVQHVQGILDGGNSPVLPLV